MSPSTVVAEAIGNALRQVAMFAIWMILVTAVVVAIATGLRALGGRQAAGLRDQVADRQAIHRRALTRRTLRTGPGRRAAVPYVSSGPGGDQSAPKSPRVPAHSGHLALDG
jgi:hypothetical protein